jgi:LCP family protein required for cell wall assembly
MSKPRLRNRLWFRILGAGFYVLVCASVLLCATAFGYLYSGEAGRAVMKQFLLRRTPQDVFGADTLTVLLLGCDEDVTTGGKKVIHQQARSDMMLLAKFDFKNHRITGLSIPRDILWELPGYHKMKINAYHEVGGNELSKKAVEDLLGIRIDRVMALDFDAFQQMVDLVGGVEVFVDKKMDYDDNAGHLHIHLKPGRQIMNGYNAMCFVRMRHSDSDFMRSARQHEFIEAFKNTIKQKPFLIQQVASKAKEALGGVLSMDELVVIAQFARTLSGDNMQMGLVPVVDGEKGTGYGWYVDLDTSKVQDVLRQYHFVDGPASEASSPASPDGAGTGTE